MTKRKIEKITLLLGCALGLSYGLEFGSMGNTSAGMGGAGVAVKDSAWGLYYNPALLGADRRAKFGYSFGLTMKEQNLLQMLELDTENITNMQQSLNDQLTGVGGASVTIGGQKVDGAIGGMLNALFPTTQTPGTITAGDMQTLLQSLDSTASCTDFAGCASAIQNNPDLAAKFKDKLQSAATEGGSPLIGSIIGSIEAEKLGSIIDDFSQGKTSADEILTTAGKITIAKGTDSVIDKFLDDFKLVDGALKGNDMNLSSQNGFVFQIAGARKTRTIDDDKLGQITIKESVGGRGAVGFGLFASVYANASMRGTNPNQYNQLIFKVKEDPNNSANDVFYKVSINGGNINLETSTQTDFENSSYLATQAEYNLRAQTLSLVEIPIGYGHTFFTKAGDINFGFAVKFIQMLSYGYNQNIKFTEMGKDTAGNDQIHFSKPSIDMPSPTFPDDFDISQTAGLDMGLLYTPTFLKNLHIGLVAKNLNAPMIKLSKSGSGDFTLKPQFRMGASYTIKDFLTLAFDADLVPNDTLSFYSPKSQTIGGGAMANFKWIDLRVGVMQDIKSQAGEGLILTGGFNLFGFLDLAVQYGLGKTYTIQDTINLPNYLSVKLGGSFSF